MSVGSRSRFGRSGPEQSGLGAGDAGVAVEHGDRPTKTLGVGRLLLQQFAVFRMGMQRVRHSPCCPVVQRCQRSRALLVASGCAILSTSLDSPAMGKVDADDLIGAAEVAAILRLSHPSSVTTYLRRYPDFPRPAVDVSASRVRLWRRQDIERWHRNRTQS